jgi:hypothetical protein
LPVSQAALFLLTSIPKEFCCPEWTTEIESPFNMESFHYMEDLLLWILY